MMESTWFDLFRLGSLYPVPARVSISACSWISWIFATRFSAFISMFMSVFGVYMISQEGLRFSSKWTTLVRAREGQLNAMLASEMAPQADRREWSIAAFGKMTGEMGPWPKLESSSLVFAHVALLISFWMWWKSATRHRALVYKLMLLCVFVLNMIFEKILCRCVERAIRVWTRIGELDAMFDSKMALQCLWFIESSLAFGKMACKLTY